MPDTGPQPSLTQAIKAIAVDADMRQFIMRPAVVDEVDSATGLLGLTVAVHDGDELPKLVKVPLIMLGSGQFSITFPVEVGATGFCLFSDRDIQRFKLRGKIEKAQTRRNSSLSDAVFMPMPIDDATRPVASPDKLIIAAGGSVFSMDSGGDIEVTGNLTVTGNVDISGDVSAAGNIDATGDVSATGSIAATVDVTAGPTNVSLLTHVHVGSPTSPVGPVTPTGTPVP